MPEKKSLKKVKLSKSFQSGKGRYTPSTIESEASMKGIHLQNKQIWACYAIIA